jgi:hypothetical protein
MDGIASCRPEPPSIHTLWDELAALKVHPQLNPIGIFESNPAMRNRDQLQPVRTNAAQDFARWEVDMFRFKSSSVNPNPLGRRWAYRNLPGEDQARKLVLADPIIDVPATEAARIVSGKEGGFVRRDDQIGDSRGVRAQKRNGDKVMHSFCGNDNGTFFGADRAKGSEI